jgi:hypothetical protein
MLAASITLATATLVAGAVVDVRSSTPCPSSDDVAERLRPLLPADKAAGAVPDIATVDRPPGMGELRIRLVRPSGAEVGDRRVPAQGECSDAAAMVAAVIAAWETEPLELAATNDVSPASSPASIKTAAPPRWRLFVGAGGGAALVDGVAAAGRLEATVESATSRWQGRIGVGGETSRSRSLLGGSVDWRHTTFEATLVLRTMHPSWRFSFEAGASLGWATLNGQGFSDNHRRASFEYGGVASLRVSRLLGRFSVWGEARTYAWPNGQRASVSGDDQANVDLPRVDVTANLGFSAPVRW